jgi:F-type H+-transporting ATPase subunit delta
MSDIKVSKRYAKALFEFAIEQKSMETIKADMDYLHQLCSVSPEFMAMLKSPVIKVNKKMQVIKAVMGTQISTTTMTFLTIIAKARRETIIPSLSLQFIVLYDELIGLKKVNIKVASELTELVRNQIISILGQQTGKQIQLDETIDPSLIGGFILNVDDQQFDASIQSKLNNLKHVLTQPY